MPTEGCGTPLGSPTIPTRTWTRSSGTKRVGSPRRAVFTTRPTTVRATMAPMSPIRCGWLANRETGKRGLAFGRGAIPPTAPTASTRRPRRPSSFQPTCSTTMRVGGERSSPCAPARPSIFSWTRAEAGLVFGRTSLVGRTRIRPTRTGSWWKALREGRASCLSIPVLRRCTSICREGIGSTATTCIFGRPTEAPPSRCICMNSKTAIICSCSSAAGARSILTAAVRLMARTFTNGILTTIGQRATAT